MNIELISIKFIKFQLRKEKSISQTVRTKSVSKETTGFVNTASINEPILKPQSLIEITSDDKQDSRDKELIEKLGKNGENLSTWDPESKR